MARNSKDSGGFIPIDSLKHKDGRPNIPTEELRDFVTADETSPSTMLYPRDPSIHPQALVENLRDTARASDPEPELTLFADFNGIELTFPTPHSLFRSNF